MCNIGSLRVVHTYVFTKVLLFGVVLLLFVVSSSVVV